MLIISSALMSLWCLTWGLFLVILYFLMKEERSGVINVSWGCPGHSGSGRMEQPFGFFTNFNAWVNKRSSAETFITSTFGLKFIIVLLFQKDCVSDERIFPVFLHEWKKPFFRICPGLLWVHQLCICRGKCGNMVCGCCHGALFVQKVHVTPNLNKSTVTSHQPQQKNRTYITAPLAAATELWGH